MLVKVIEANEQCLEKAIGKNEQFWMVADKACIDEYCEFLTEEAEKYPAMFDYLKEEEIEIRKAEEIGRPVFSLFSGVGEQSKYLAISGQLIVWVDGVSCDDMCGVLTVGDSIKDALVTAFDLLTENETGLVSDSIEFCVVME